MNSPHTASASRSRTGQGFERVVLVNPLRVALAHYETALTSNLRSAGVIVDAQAFDEPSASNGSRTRWILRYLQALRAARRLSRDSEGGVLLVILWPVLGYVDVVLTRLLCRTQEVRLVMHDPRPLVHRAIGYSSLARRLATLSCRRIRLIVHGDEARQAIREDARRLPVVEMPHPFVMQAPTSDPEAPDAVVSESPPVLRVLGQFKKERDLDVMREVGEELGDEWRLEIHGRGWPPVDGWRVVDGFVEEDAFQDLISGSTAVLIPYHRLYQSGVAVRCLESGTPFVGPDVGSLRYLYGSEAANRLLVESGGAKEAPGRWAAAVRACVELDRSGVHALGLKAQAFSVSAWKSLALGDETLRARR